MHDGNIPLTEAEWAVMECLWERAPRTGREAVEWLKEKKGWNRSTTLTLLHRLEEKGAVTADTEGSLKSFRPAISRDEAALHETESFLGRVYKGSVSLLVSALTQKQTLSRSEIDELYAILAEMEEKQDG